MLRISADPADLDVGLIHRYLSQESYWARGIPRTTVERALQHSICYGGYLEGGQVAFARAVTDQATFAYLADVFVLDGHRRQGHGRRIVEALRADPRLQGLRRWHLVTRDMQPMYLRLGFSALAHPERHMEDHAPDAYRDARD